MMVEQGDSGAATGGEGSSSTGESGAPEKGGSTEESGDGGAGSGEGVEGGEGDITKRAPAYSPNFKFKYRGLDKDNEAELDDLFKPLVKDAATEKKIRELHEKAYGLDFVKAERDRLKNEHQELAGYKQRMAESLGIVSGYLNKNDLESFFGAFKIPKESVLRYALQQIQLNEMNPEQRAAYETQRQEMQRASALELQNQRLQEQFSQLQVNQRTNELATVMSRAGIADAASSFDQRMGRPGAFREMVVQRGQYHALSSGVDMPAEQVVAEVLAMIGHQPQAGGTQAPGGLPGVAGASAHAPAAKPVLPNIQGKGTSPAKKVLTSTDDLRKRAAELSAGE